MIKQVKPVWDDETFDGDDAYREKITGAMPGVLLSDIDEIDEREAVYSVKAEGEEVFSLYRGQCVEERQQPEIEVQRLGYYSARELLDELSKLDFVMSDEAARDLRFPTAENLFWESARESLPGEYIGAQRVESASGAWRSEWSVESDADGCWNLYAVFEPADYSYEELEPVPELRGNFDTREEAIAAIETESWE